MKSRGETAHLCDGGKRFRQTRRTIQRLDGHIRSSRSSHCEQGEPFWPNHSFALYEALLACSTSLDG